MNGFTFQSRDVPGPRPGDPRVEVTLNRPGTRKRPGAPLDLAHWGLAGGRAAEALAWLRTPLGAEASLAEETASRILIPARRLDFLPEWLHATLGLPHACDLPIVVRLATEGRVRVSWDVQGLGSGLDRPSIDDGFHGPQGARRHLVPGLQQALDRLSAPDSAGRPPGLDLVEERALDVMSYECWIRLRRDGHLKLLQATRFAMMANHSLRYGYTQEISPVDPVTGTNQFLHDPDGEFMSRVNALGSAPLPRCLPVGGVAIYLGDAFMKCAEDVRTFNLMSFHQRTYHTLNMQLLIAQKLDPRCISRYPVFPEKVTAYGEVGGEDALDLAMSQRDAFRTAQPLRIVRKQPPADADTAGVRDEIALDFAPPSPDYVLGGEDAFQDPGSESDRIEDAIPEIDAGGSPAQRAENGPEHGAETGQEGAPAFVRFRTGHLISIENLGSETLDWESGEPRPDPGPGMLAQIMAQVAPGATAHPHQVSGAEHMAKVWASTMNGFLLCDEPGTGKTMTLLMGMMGLSHISTRPGLLVVEDHLVDFVKRELRTKIAGTRTFTHAHGSDFRRFAVAHQVKLIEKPGLVLTTWSTLADLHHMFVQIEFGIVACDEASQAKNPLSIRRQTLKGIRADLLVLATGTPVENSLGDLWSLVDLVRPGLLPPWKVFKGRYVEGIPSQEETDDLKRLLMGGDVPTLLRRTKDGLSLGIPAKIVKRTELEMRGRHAVEYATEARKLRNAGSLHRKLREISLHPDFGSIPRGAGLHQDSTRNFVMQSCVLAWTLNALERAQIQGRKVLIFATDIAKGQDPVALALGWALGLGRPLTAISGRTPERRRQEAVREFRTSKGFDVLMLSNRLCSRGLTLTEASTVIMLSRWFNPAIEDQAMDRVHRIGLQHEVEILVPLARHPEFGDASYDLVLDRVLDEKRSTSGSFLDLSRFTPEDLRSALVAPLAA
jgi:hypothetical protein